MNMNLNMIQILGVMALVLGAVLLVFAYNASSAPIEQLSNTLTGRYTDQTMWCLLLGIAAAVTGGVLVLSGKRNLLEPSSRRPIGSLRSHLFLGSKQMLGTILLILLVLVLIGALPTWPHSSNWGYFPTGAVGIVLIAVVALLVTGRI